MNCKTYLTALVAILFLGHIAPLAAQPSVQQQKDSLRRVIENAEGKAKLRAYNKLYSLYMLEIGDDRKMDTLATLFKETEAEAVRQGNLSAQALAKGNLLVCYLNRGEYDKVIEMSPECLDFYARNKQWRFYYQIHMNMIVACNFIGEYEQAVQEAEKMYNLAREQKDDGGMGSALYATGSAYLLQDRIKEGEEAFRECIRLLSTVPAYYNTLTQAYAYLCMALRGQGRNDEILRLMPDYEKAILDLEKVSGRHEPESWANFYTAFMYTYVEIGEYDKAETYAARVESINNNNIGQGDVARVRARIAIGRGNYDRALAEVDSAAAALPDLDYNQNGLRKIKMEILARIGRYDEAMKLFDDILAANDSIKDVEVNARFDELRTQYEVEKHIAEKERTFHYLLFALGISLVLLLLLAGVFYYNRMMAAKNRKLYERIKEQDRMAEELARIYHAAQEAPAGEDATADESSDDDVLPGTAETAAATPPAAISNEYLLLVARLREYLLSDENRSGTEITRDEMVTALGTNRTTLTEAVRTVTGMTPMEYTRSMKLEEARKMLDEHPDLTVESVALSCGFNLPGTFYRLFKKQYGLTPMEYRKMAQAEKK